MVTRTSQPEQLVAAAIDYLQLYLTTGCESFKTAGLDRMRELGITVDYSWRGEAIIRNLIDHLRLCW